MNNSDEDANKSHEAARSQNISTKSNYGHNMEVSLALQLFFFSLLKFKMLKKQPSCMKISSVSTLMWE